MLEIRKKVLCIEDDVETASLISDELNDRGYVVAIASRRARGIDLDLSREA